MGLIKIVERIFKKKGNEKRPRSKGKEGGSVIIEVDEETHNLILKKEKLNIG